VNLPCEAGLNRISGHSNIPEYHAFATWYKPPPVLDLLPTLVHPPCIVTMSTPPGPVLEIFTFLASAALLKDETVIHPAFEQIRTRKGLQQYVESKLPSLHQCLTSIYSVYEGTGIEEPNRRWLILGGSICTG
jgi:hypothetical protein